MRLTEQVHLELKRTLRVGDTALDATAGNGHDTLAMAELVGPSGKVISIDLQADAIASTRSRLEEAGQLAQCELIEGDHADALNEQLANHRENIAVITFNLGYLPGGDKGVTTSPETTLHALDAAQHLLRTRGILLVTAYRGHPGGMDEAEQVEIWMRNIPKTAWQVEARESQNRNPDRIPPILWLAQKQKQD